MLSASALTKTFWTDRWKGVSLAIANAVMEEVTAWQNRPLELCCAVIFPDAIRVNIRSDGAVSNKAVFVAQALQHGPDGDIDEGLCNLQDWRSSRR